MGTFAAVQTAGVVGAPLIGGLAGAADYRLAFVAAAGVALLLAAVPVPGGPRAERRARLRDGATPRTVRLSAAAALTYLSVSGLGGAVSLVGAFKFAGNAVAPVLWLPLYAIEPLLAFAGAGAAAALVALATLRAAAASTGPQRAQGPVETGPPSPESARRTTELGTP